MQYTEKPRIVEANQFIFGNPKPPGLCDCAAKGGVAHYHNPANGDPIEVESGDWVIVERNGNVSTCSPDEFTTVYEPLAKPTP